jgi:DNA-damage-inducible protein D
MRPFLFYTRKGINMNDLIETVKYDGRVVIDKGIRYFPVVDLIKALTDSADPKDYWYRMQRRENIELSTLCRKLKLPSTDGKSYTMDCVTMEGAFRLIQSIPSPKVEPLKLALARLASERVEEMQNPELGIHRAKQRAVKSYRAKGMTDEWISDRLIGIDDRHQFTDLLKSIGAQGSDYARITARTHVASFGLTPSDHKELKGLDKKDKLRDYMVRA